MELFAADGHDAGGCERVTGKSGMRPAVPKPDPAEFTHRIAPPSARQRSMLSARTYGSSSTAWESVLTSMPNDTGAAMLRTCGDKRPPASP